MPTPIRKGRPAGRGRKEKKAIRTTISLNPVIHEWASRAIEEEGFQSLSDFVAFLIRERHNQGRRCEADSESQKTDRS